MQTILTIAQIANLLRKNNLLIKSFNCENDKKLTAIQTDSSKLAEDNLFCCIKGLQTDGHTYFDQAEKAKCGLFVCEYKLPVTTPQIIVKDSRTAAGLIASEFFRIDFTKLKLAGITGTNGKTTTAYLAWQLATLCGLPAAYIGTIGCYYKNKVKRTSLTTPDIIELYELISLLQKEGIKLIFMEVSSHALSMKRLDTLRFDCAAFLNLSKDHLDFHQDMEAYAKAKNKLFQLMKKDGTAIINTDSEYGDSILQDLNCRGFSFGNNKDITIDNIEINSDISEFTLTISDKSNRISSPLPGVFNFQNISFAIAILYCLNENLSLEEIANQIPQLKSAPGRLEIVDNALNKKVFIDYAHTPDAIEKATSAMRPFVEDRLITIIGAGGNRDRTKRPEMLQKALIHSDIVIITTDNPRKENPVEIIKDITDGISPDARIWIKTDRETAILDALNAANANDLILITGKGHEDYQDIDGVKIPFNEKEIIRKNADMLLDKEIDINFDRIMLEYVAAGRISESINTVIKNIATDSRNMKSHSLFIPIKGEHFDGHNYIESVIADTSCIALCENSYNIDNNRIIKVEDTVITYGLIAKSYRTLLGTNIIAVTGSTGKTSVKEYLFTLINSKWKTAKTNFNENNFIGVPKTLLTISPNDTYAVIELGTNHFGEIDWLSNITKPDSAVITNIGASHLEFLNNLEGVFKEKSAIFKHGCKKCFYPGDDRHFHETAGISFGFNDSNDHVFNEFTKLSSGGYSFKINKHEYTCGLNAKFQVENVAKAAVIALEEGLSPAEIQEALSKLPDIDNRLELIQKGKMLIISDCYNANPDSMKAAVEYWNSRHPDKPHIAFLGSMLELGESSRQFHTEIGELVNKSKPYMFIAIGSDAIAYNAHYHYEKIENLINCLDKLKLSNEAVILVKGSHGIHLERLIERLK